MIRPLLYVAECDPCGTRFGTASNQFALRRGAEAAGWKLRRRKDGEVASRGGKDYCPRCIPRAWSDTGSYAEKPVGGADHA